MRVLEILRGAVQCSLYSRFYSNLTYLCGCRFGRLLLLLAEVAAEAHAAFGEAGHGGRVKLPLEALQHELIETLVHP